MGEQMTLESIMAEFTEALKVCEGEIGEAVKGRDRAKENVKAQSAILRGLGRKRTSLLHALGRVDEGRRKKKVGK